MLDSRDDRMMSPFQAWLVKEIMTNSASSINVLTEKGRHAAGSCRLPMRPSSRSLAGSQGQLSKLHGHKDLQRNGYNGNENFFHWISRRFRVDTDLSVQQKFADELFIRDVCKGRVLSVVVAVLGWRVLVQLRPDMQSGSQGHCRCYGDSA